MMRARGIGGRGALAAAVDPVTDITLSASSIAENAAQGANVGTLSTNLGVSVSWEITNNSDFQLSASTGVTVSLQRSGTGTITEGADESITIRATRSGTSAYDEGFTITVTAASSGTLLETLTLDNFSGASRTDPFVMFERKFEAGAVPSGSFVEMRYSGTALTVQQGSQRSYHGDGSLRGCWFAGQVPAGAVSDNGTVTVALYAKSGTFTDTTSITARTSITAEDYRTEVVISGTTYYGLVDNFDTAGDYEVCVQGPAICILMYNGVLRNGTGGADTAHGQLHARTYIGVLHDGRHFHWPVLINGKIGAGQSYSVTSAAFKNGASAITSFGAFTFYAHNKQYLVGTDALPTWSSNATNFWARIDPDYVADKNISPKQYTTATQIAAIGSGTADDYVANGDAGFGTTGIDGGGASEWIGIWPTWSSDALLTNNKTRIRNDRVRALSSGVKHGLLVVDDTTGRPPVFTDETYAGFPAATTTITWHSNSPTYTDTGGSYAGAATNLSHGPNYFWFQAATTGMPWWYDDMLDYVCGCMAAKPSGTRNWTAGTPSLTGCLATYGQARDVAWSLRELSQGAYFLPDAHPGKQYFLDALDVSLAYQTKSMSSPNRDAAYDAIGQWLTGEGKAEDMSQSLWHRGYVAIVTDMLERRGQITSTHKIVDHLDKFFLGALRACFYQGAGRGYIGIRTGSTPNTSDPYATDFTDVWVGSDASTTTIADGLTVKLISDAGGTSGSCPGSGNAIPWEPGHSYPVLHQIVCSVMDRLGVADADTFLALFNAMEDAATVNESTDWANGQWRLVRVPA